MLKHIMTVCAPCIINDHPELLCSTSQHELDLELFEVISVIYGKRCKNYGFMLNFL